MLKFILALLLFMQVGCSGIATYTMVTAGTLSGEVLHDAVKDHQADKENDSDGSKEKGIPHIRKNR